MEWSGWKEGAPEMVPEMRDGQGRVGEKGPGTERPLCRAVGPGQNGEPREALNSSGHTGGWAFHTLRPWPGSGGPNLPSGEVSAMGVGWRCEVPTVRSQLEKEGPLETAETVTHPSLPPELGVLHLLSSFRMLGQCPGPLAQT